MKKALMLIKNAEAYMKKTISLIASENYASNNVLSALSSRLSDKYAEGYSGKRYYAGCRYIDQLEDYACDIIKNIFQYDYANIQPHSGSQANAAIMMSTLAVNDTIMGLSLNSGGHLTHGSKVNFSGKIFNVATYEVEEDGRIDMDKVSQIALEHKPKLIIAGYSAYSRFIDWAKFKQIATSINALFLADIAHIAGLIATNHFPSPSNFADIVSSTTHKTLRGPRGGLILCNDPLLAKKLNRGVFPMTQGGPQLNNIAAKAIAFEEIQLPEYNSYIKQCLLNAQAMCKVFIEEGIDIVSKGTDTHIILLDLRNLGINGLKAQETLESYGVLSNKNMIPHDKLSPTLTSGLRIGTAAISSRGADEQFAAQLAYEVSLALKGKQSNLELLVRKFAIKQ